MRNRRDIENKLIRMAKKQAPNSWSRIEARLEPQLLCRPQKRETSIWSSRYYKATMAAAGLALIMFFSIGVLPHLLNTQSVTEHTSAPCMGSQHQSCKNETVQSRTDEHSSAGQVQDGYKGVSSKASKSMEIEYRSATAKKINAAMGITLGAFENIPSDLTVSSYELAYIKGTGTVLYGRVTFKSTKEPLRSIAFTVKKGGSQTKNQMTNPDLAAGMPSQVLANSGAYTKPGASPQSGASKNALESAQSSQGAQAGYPNTQSGGSFEDTVFIHVNSGDIGLKRSVNPDSDIVFSSNIAANNVSYAVDAQNLSLEEIAQIFAQILK